MPQKTAASRKLSKKHAKAKNADSSAMDADTTSTATSLQADAKNLNSVAQ
jgi:hypothetical protein